MDLFPPAAEPKPAEYPQQPSPCPIPRGARLAVCLLPGAAFACALAAGLAGRATALQVFAAAVIAALAESILVPALHLKEWKEETDARRL